MPAPQAEIAGAGFQGDGDVVPMQGGGAVDNRETAHLSIFSGREGPSEGPDRALPQPQDSTKLQSSPHSS